MKEYQTWEVIKMITENTNLRFQALSFMDKKIIPKFLRLDTETNVIICTAEVSYNDCLYYDQMWILIEKPVSFVEAVKAYVKGKAIKCKLGDTDYKYINRRNFIGDTYGYYIKNDNNVINNDITTAEILNGKWFIEEDK